MATKSPGLRSAGVAGSVRVILVVALSSSVSPSASVSLLAVALWTLPCTRVAAPALGDADGATAVGDAADVTAVGLAAPLQAAVARATTSRIRRITQRIRRETRRGSS